MSLAPRELWRRFLVGLAAPRGLRRWLGLALALGGPRIPATPFDLKRVQRLLVIRYDGMGDLVVTTGFFRELRRAAPQAKITLLTRSEWVPLMRACPHFDEVLGFKAVGYGRYQELRRQRDALAFARRELWPRRFEAALVPQSEFAFFEARALAFASGAPTRIGWADPAFADDTGGRSLLTRVVPLKASWHEADKSYAFLEALGGQVRARQLELHWDAVAAAVGLELATTLKGSTRMLVAIGLGASQANKLWPVARFIEVARALGVTQSMRFVGIGGDDLVKAGEALVAGLGEQAVSLAGKLPWPQTAALLASCDLFVGCDSGPMHVAAAVGTPVVTLSGCPTDAPTDYHAHPGRIGPYCRHQRVVQPRLIGRGPGFFAEDIQVEDVRAAAASLLAEVRGSRDGTRDS